MSGRAPGDIDRRPIRQRGSGWARTIARWLASAGVSPNAISIFSVVASIGTGAAFYATTLDTGLDRLLWLAGAFLIFLRLLANMFAGLDSMGRCPDFETRTVSLVGQRLYPGGTALSAMERNIIHDKGLHFLTK